MSESATMMIPEPTPLRGPAQPAATGSHHACQRPPGLSGAIHRWRQWRGVAFGRPRHPGRALLDSTDRISVSSGQPVAAVVGPPSQLGDAWGWWGLWDRCDAPAESMPSFARRTNVGSAQIGR